MFHWGLKSIGVLLLLLFSQLSFATTPNITFGPLDGGTNDGTEPFGLFDTDAAGEPLACGSATDTDMLGADCGERNRVVRTQDVVTHLWSISVNGGDASIPAGDQYSPMSLSSKLFILHKLPKLALKACQRLVVKMQVVELILPQAL